MNRSEVGPQTRSREGVARVVINARLRPAQAEELRQLARRRDLPQATLIRQAVARFLAEEAAQ